MSNHAISTPSLHHLWDYLSYQYPATKGDIRLRALCHEIATMAGKPKRKLDDKERSKGRSENYWQMSAEEQWAEDKRLGILDWDGN